MPDKLYKYRPFGVNTMRAIMWSHYADEHRGICIEYDTRDQGHPRLQAVDYQGPRAIRTSDLYRWKVRDDAAAKEQLAPRARRS